MRELKFRAWDKATNSFVKDPWKIYLTDGGPSVSIDGVWATKDIVLQQYTGIKDLNGKEIYEGDLMFTLATGAPAIFQVVFTDGAFVCSSRHTDALPNLGDILTISECNVIGNVWENPELLTREEKV